MQLAQNAQTTFGYAIIHTHTNQYKKWAIGEHIIQHHIIIALLLLDNALQYDCYIFVSHQPHKSHLTYNTQ